MRAGRAKRMAALAVCAVATSGCWKLHTAAQPASWPPTAKLFVAHGMGSSITVHEPGWSGDAAPDAVMGLVLTGSGIAVDAGGRTYVANDVIDSVAVFAPGAAGGTPPIATIRGGRTRLESPDGVALDARGNVYVANFGSYDRYRGTITVYPAGSDGNVAPIATIGGPKTRLHACSDVAVDAGGRIYVTNGGVVGDAGSVTVYAPGSDGDVAPIATIAGPRTRLDWPRGIAVDAAGRIVVANGRSNGAMGSVTVYAKGSHGDVAPIATIRGPISGIRSAQGVAVDSRGTIYVGSNAREAPMPNPRELGPPDSVLVFRAGADGDVAPMRTITGDATGIDGPGGIALDRKGGIHLVNVGGGWNGHPAKITVYPAGADGDVAPLATMAGTPDTGIENPMAIAVAADGTTYVANQESVTVHPKGTDRNVPPIATIRGLHTRLVRPWAIAVDAAGSIYVANVQGADAATGTITVYRPGDDGDVAPARIITGAAIGANPRSIALDPRGHLYVARGGTPGALAVFAAGSDGQALPIATVAGEHTGITVPNGIAVDAAGRIYCANFGRTVADRGNVTVYAPVDALPGAPGYPDVAPIATIAGPQSGLRHPRGIALDSIGRIYVLDETWERHEGPEEFYSVSASVAVLPPLGERTGFVDEAPVASLAGPNTMLDMSADGIAVLDAVGR